MTLNCSQSSVRNRSKHITHNTLRNVFIPFQIVFSFKIVNVFSGDLKNDYLKMFVIVCMNWFLDQFFPMWLAVCVCNVGFVIIVISINIIVKQSFMLQRRSLFLAPEYPLFVL